MVIMITFLIGLSGVATGNSAELNDGKYLSASPYLSSLIDEAITENNDIKSMQEKLLGMKEKTDAAGSLPDPMLGLSVLNLPTSSYRFDEQAMTQKQIAISQKVPWYGKRSLQSSMAEKNYQKYEAIILAKKIDLSRKIAQLYYDLGIVETSLRMNKKLIEMLSQTVSIAEARYSSGNGAQQDIFQAQVELSKLLNEKNNLEEMKQMKVLKLNELINRDKVSVIKPPVDLKEPLIELTLSDLKTIMIENNPLLMTQKREIENTRIETDLAKKEYYPDIEFKLAYGQRDKDMTGKNLDDFLSASVTFPIPLWKNSKQDKILNSAEKENASATASYQNLMVALPYQIEGLVTEIDTARKNYHLYKNTLIVQADQWARSALSNFEVGKVDFGTMMNARIRLLRLQLQAEMYIYSIYQKQAELEALIGKPVFGNFTKHGKDITHE